MRVPHGQQSHQPKGTVLLILTVVSVTSTLLGQDALPRRSARLGAAAFGVDLGVVDSPNRTREGTRLEKVEGILKMVGDRVAFFPDDDQEPFRILENLALERIWRMLDQSRGRTWIISGTVTEYRGGNYLLISRAVLKAKARSSTRTTLTSDAG